MRSLLQKAEFIIKSVRYLDQYFEKSINEKAEKSGVTFPQLRVIKEVVKYQGISIKQISQNLNMAQSTVSGIVERLIKKGILLKKTNSHDKRFAEIWYTTDVSEFLENHSKEFVSEAIRDVFRNLQSSDVEIITQGLQLLTTAVEKASQKRGT